MLKRMVAEAKEYNYMTIVIDTEGSHAVERGGLVNGCPPLKHKHTWGNISTFKRHQSTPTSPSSPTLCCAVATLHLAIYAAPA